MKASIITIGDEILIGQIVDTNSASIARHLNAAGIVVRQRSSVGDERAQIVEELRQAMRQSDIVVMTGGLGPTKDDITKKTLAELFGARLVRDEAVFDHVHRMLAARGVAFNRLNQDQALVPDNAEILFNRHGTAPGMWFEHEGKVIVSLPGVPFEMEHLMTEEVMPRLRERFSLRQIVHRTLVTAGMAESVLAETIAAWEDALPEYLHLAYLPAAGMVRLRLSAYEVENGVEQEIDEQFAALRKIIPGYVLGFEGVTPEQVVHDRMTRRGLTLAVAESCTGGAIAARFTAMPGASAYFQCGVVAYGNTSKSAVLGVDPTLIARHGAVSEEVARAMAEGARRISGADYAVSTTGIAGPSGGSTAKPVGTVWFAVAGPRRTAAVLQQCGTDRSQIIARASSLAITLLRDEIERESV